MAGSLSYDPEDSSSSSGDPDASESDTLSLEPGTPMAALGMPPSAADLALGEAGAAADSGCKAAADAVCRLPAEKRAKSASGQGETIRYTIADLKAIRGSSLVGELPQSARQCKDLSFLPAANGGADGPDVGDDDERSARTQRKKDKQKVEADGGQRSSLPPHHHTTRVMPLLPAHPSPAPRPSLLVFTHRVVRANHQSA